jgi:transposase
VVSDVVADHLAKLLLAEEIGDKIGVSGPIGNTPVYLGVDEFVVKKGRLYHTAICDLSARQVMGVEPGHTGQSLSAFLDRLSELEKVKAVVMDTRAWSQALGTGMHEPYRQAVGMCCPNAVVIADKFHVVRKVNEALDKRRVLEQGQEKTGKRKLFLSRYLLLKARGNLAPEELLKLQVLLDIYPALKVAWELKEKFRDIYLALNRSEAESQLKQWVNEVRACALPEFIGLLSIVRNWGLEMLNYFDYRLTNGYVEGKNNRIKVLKRIAYGYRDIKVFVERIFLTNEATSSPRALKFSYHTY